jgi:predicted RND superfamily exporter protein
VSLLIFLDIKFLGIGTDDAFLLLAAWRETDCSESVEIRIEKTLKHSGVAILITSLADSLAFLVGGITSMPAVKYFSLYSSVAIFFIYIYTISLFSAIMVLQGRWEQISRNSVWGCKTRAELDVSWFSKIFNMGSRHKFKKHSLWYQKIFAGTFCDCISHPIIQWTALISYTIYISFTVYGLTQLDVGFDLMNIVKKGSSTEHFIQLRTKYFIEDVSNLDVAVLNPPNMGNKTQRVLFLTDLNRLENAKCSTGRPHTKFWFFNYKEYLNNMGFGAFNEDTDLNYTVIC